MLIAVDNVAQFFYDSHLVKLEDWLWSEMHVYQKLCTWSVNTDEIFLSISGRIVYESQEHFLLLY